MYTIDRIKSEFRDVCKSQGVVVTTPIAINSRLTRTLGRVCYDKNYLGHYIPTKVEFSKKYIEECTDECVRQTILHEAAHYILMKKNPAERCGHNQAFRDMCSTLGCARNRAKGDVEYTDEYKAKVEEDKKKIYKYEVFCDKCGEKCGRYHRQGKVLKNLTVYKSGCCKAKLIMVQNF